MVEVKLRGKSQAETIADRLRDSGLRGDVNTHHGEGPTRAIEHHHHKGSQHGSTTETDSEGV
jgi:hypothetical protein